MVSRKKAERCMQKVGGRLGCPIFVMVMYAESPKNHLRITYESPMNH